MVMMAPDEEAMQYQSYKHILILFARQTPAYSMCSLRPSRILHSCIRQLFHASPFYFHSDSTDSDGEGQSGYRKGGYHPVSVGEQYNQRYTIEKKLGWGHFSTVWLASDSKVPDDDPRKLVALKIQKSASQYVDAAMDEIELLSVVKKNRAKDPMGADCMVELLDHFVIYGPHGKRKHPSPHIPSPPPPPSLIGVYICCFASFLGPHVFDACQTRHTHVNPLHVHMTDVCLVFETMGPNLLSLIKRFVGNP